MVRLRGWQEKAFQIYLQNAHKKSTSMLWEATPGAGKTAAALHVIKHQLRNRIANKVIVIVPTSHLRTQWAHAALGFGLQLDSSFGGKRTFLASEFHGLVVTYQQMARRGRYFQELSKGAIVILDEVHHAGDGLTWGDSLRSAFQEASFILCLSGTAFRSDTNPIPFVKYDSDGVSTPDYVYSYEQAVKEGVCRPTAFFTYGGTVSWSDNNQVYTGSFGDPLDRMNSARMLRACLDPESNWIQPMLKDAHEMLLATRKEQKEAGGLIVCADQTHAREIAKLMTAVSGEKSTVVLSDDTTASKRIKQYASGSGMWLVACNMVSEGVDIPRLRVGIYATTVRTKMYFRQFLGRIVRRQSHVPGQQVSYFYLPADPLLHQMAEEIEHETRHALYRKDDELFGDDERAERRRREETSAPSWMALHSINSGVDSVILNGTQLSLFGGVMSSPTQESVKEAVDFQVGNLLSPSLSKSEMKLELASRIKKLVGQVHRKTNSSHSVIHSTLNKVQSVKSQTYCTEVQLVERINLLEQMLERNGVARKAA